MGRIWVVKQSLATDCEWEVLGGLEGLVLVRGIYMPRRQRPRRIRRTFFVVFGDQFENMYMVYTKDNQLVIDFASRLWVCRGQENEHSGMVALEPMVPKVVRSNVYVCRQIDFEVWEVWRVWWCFEASTHLKARGLDELCFW